VFAVVGHIGSGTSEVAKWFKQLLERQDSPYQTRILKAAGVIEKWAKNTGHSTPNLDEPRSIDNANAWQDLGDKMRFDTMDHAAVAKGLIREIRNTRAADLTLKLLTARRPCRMGPPVLLY
jgi:hypothetical protein